MRLLLPAVVACALLAGCARTADPAAPVQPYVDTLSPTSAQPAAPAPTDFPVTATPRPIVLMGPRLVAVDIVGDDAEKSAVGSGRFAFTGAEPPAPGPTSVALPGGPATLPLIGVRDAVAAMSADGREGEPLELVSAELGTAEFPTDRGRWELPAWRFRSAFGSTWAWPAVTPEAFWEVDRIHHSPHRATTSGGVEIEVQLPVPGSPCPGEEPAVREPTAAEPVVTESATHVMVGVGTGGGGGGCGGDLMLLTEPRTVELGEPLGARLLVDERNGIVPVEMH